MNSSRFFTIIGFFSFAGLVSTWLLDFSDSLRLGSDFQADLVFNSINIYKVNMIGLLTALFVELMVMVDAYCTRRIMTRTTVHNTAQ